jgi:DNA-binding transcriptional ArsR family regulator
MSPHVNEPLRIVTALSDPIRYAVVQHLMSGPATVSELVAHTGAAQSKVSNHLALLRSAGLVETSRSGRYVAYELADPAVASVIEALERASHTGAAAAREVPEIALARSCYDHLAGRLGVALFRSLVARRAIRDVRTSAAARKGRSGLGEVELGRDASAVFGALAIDLDEIATKRRQFATACSDWTESRPHLGGALGAALQQRLLRENWVQRRGGTRALRITKAGREELRERFGIDVAQLATARI